MELKTYLEKNGLTQAEFAAQIGRNVSTVSRIVSGEQMPGFETVEKIADTTRNRVKVADLYGTCRRYLKAASEIAGRGT